MIAAGSQLQDQGRMRVDRNRKSAAESFAAPFNFTSCGRVEASSWQRELTA